MATTLFTIPAEILLQIAFSLDFGDFINLRNARRGLLELLGGEEMDKRVAKIGARTVYLDGVINNPQAYFPCAKETQLADQGVTNYSIALRRTPVRRKNFSLAQPYSLVVLARFFGPTRISFWGGNLCYVQGSTVRILDVHNSHRTEAVIDVDLLLDQEAHYWLNHKANLQILRGEWADQFYVLGFQHGILTVGVKAGVRGTRYVVVIDVRKGCHSHKRGRVRIMWQLKGDPFIVFNSPRYLVCATDFSSWNRGPLQSGLFLKRHDLDNDCAVPDIYLPDISGCNFPNEFDIRSFDGWLYLLCCKHGIRGNPGYDNGVYYYCYRFPISDCDPIIPWKLGDPSIYSPGGPLPARLEVVRTRRKVVPARTDTTHLELVQDETTGGLLIAEARKEFDDRGNRLRSPNHFQRLAFPDPPGKTVTSPETKVEDIIQTLDEQAPADYLPQQYCRRQRAGKIAALQYSDPYNAGRRSDDYQYHITVGSQARTPLTGDNEGSSSINQSIDEVPERKKIDVTEHHLHRFPPPHAPTALTDVLSPTTGGIAWAHTISDERSAVVSWLDARRDVPGNIVEESTKSKSQITLINFDPWIRFPGLRDMTLNPPTDLLAHENHETELSHAVDGEDAPHRALSEFRRRPRQPLDQHNSREDQESESAHEGEGSTEKSSQERGGSEEDRESMEDLDVKDGDENGTEPSWFRTEKALWIDVNQGFIFV